MFRFINKWNWRPTLPLLSGRSESMNSTRDLERTSTESLTMPLQQLRKASWACELPCLLCPTTARVSVFSHFQKRKSRKDYNKWNHFCSKLLPLGERREVRPKFSRLTTNQSAKNVSLSITSSILLKPTRAETKWDIKTSRRSEWLTVDWS